MTNKFTCFLLRLQYPLLQLLYLGATQIVHFSCNSGRVSSVVTYHQYVNSIYLEYFYLYLPCEHNAHECQCSDSHFRCLRKYKLSKIHIIDTLNFEHVTITYHLAIPSFPCSFSIFSIFVMDYFISMWFSEPTESAKRNYWCHLLPITLINNGFRRRIMMMSAVLCMVWQNTRRTKRVCYKIMYLQSYRFSIDIIYFIFFFI
jgi:hypothetical protein